MTVHAPAGLHNNQAGHSSGRLRFNAGGGPLCVAQVSILCAILAQGPC